MHLLAFIWSKCHFSLSCQQRIRFNQEETDILFVKRQRVMPCHCKCHCSRSCNECSLTTKKLGFFWFFSVQNVCCSKPSCSFYWLHIYDTIINQVKKKVVLVVLQKSHFLSIQICRPALDIISFQKNYFSPEKPDNITLSLCLFLMPCF